MTATAVRRRAVRTPIRLADDLALPLDAVTETFGIFGRKGMGKSSTATTFVEQGVKFGGRFVIADPTGVWWGLMHDGTGPGLPGIVFGGEHADVPLEATAGHVVAEFVVQQDEYPVVVLDLSLMRKADRTRFMLRFLETLYHENREVLHVVLDEAHQFAPTQAREGGDTIPLLGAVEDVVALGRKRGLGITMISQRFATLNANVREQIGTLVAHQLTGALDRKALKGWIEAQADPAREKEVLDSIAKLGVGTALAWSPGFLKFFGIVNVNAPTTFDSRATPKVGQKVKRPGKRAPVDLGALRKQMAATIEEAEANDPKKLREKVALLERKVREQGNLPEARSLEVEKLRSEIARLERELAAATGTPVVTDKQVKQIESLIARAERAAQKSDETWEAVRGVLYPLSANVKDALQTRSLTTGARARATPVRVPPRLTPVRAPKTETTKESGESGAAVLTAESNGSLTGPEQRVLDAVAWYGALGNHSPTKQQVGFIAGYRVSKNVGGTYGNILGKLRNQHGLIDYAGGNVVLTERGAALARDPEIEGTNEAVQDAVIARLSGPEERVLRVLIRVWPNPMTKQEVGAAAGYTVGPNVGGTFGNILGRLRSLGVIEYPSPGEAVATDVLFPLGP